MRTSLFANIYEEEQPQGKVFSLAPKAEGEPKLPDIAVPKVDSLEAVEGLDIDWKRVFLTVPKEAGEFKSYLDVKDAFIKRNLLTPRIIPTDRTPADIYEFTKQINPIVVINIYSSIKGRDVSEINTCSIFETLGVLYTGNSNSATVLTHSKDLVRTVSSGAGIPTSKEKEFELVDGDLVSSVIWKNKAPEYSCLSTLTEETKKKIQSVSFKAWEVFKCRDYARFDFRVDGGKVLLIGVDTSPDIGEVVKILKVDMWEFLEVVIREAIKRKVII
jgi:D-alanine-D-alanine ligase-like ATP-grasp enzyme